jgi:hypothetical protein
MKRQRMMVFPIGTNHLKPDDGTGFNYERMKQATGW